jgi:hypothetical protein
MRAIDVHWAWLGKVPGNREYEVHRSSGDPSMHRDFEARIRAHVPGTPDRHRAADGSPGALPWVTFSPTDDGTTLWLGISVLDWSTEVDVTGQRVAPTDHWSAAYPDAAEAGLTYAGFFEAVASAGEPEPGGGPIRLALGPAPTAEEVAAGIDELGFEWTALVAALLLERPVALIDDGRLSLRGRLRCLDSIAALLPYGFRAGLSASTWAEPNVRHGIRLTFTDTAARHQREVNVRVTPTVRPALDAAMAHLELLQHLEPRIGAVALIRWLAAQREPCGFDDPASAPESLGKLARPFRALQGFRKGEGDPDVLRRVLAEPPVPLLPGERTELYGHFLGLGQRGQLRLPDDLELLRGHAGPELLDAMVASGRAAARARGVTPLLVACADLARDHGQLDEYLSGVLRAGADGAADGWSPELDPRVTAELLRAIVPPAPGGLPRLLDFVARREHVAALLLDAVVAQRPDLAAGWVAWLAGAEPRPAWLAPYAWVLLDGRPETAASAAPRALIERGPGRLSTLLTAAEQAGRAEQVLVSWWEELALADPGLERGDHDRLAELALRLRPDAPDRQAVADLLRLLLGRRPQWLLEGPHELRSERLKSFKAAMERYRAVAPRRRAAELADRLVRYVRDEPWFTDPSTARSALSLLSHAADGGAAIDKVVLGGLERNRALIDRPLLPVPWLTSLAERYPSLGTRCALGILRGRLRDAAGCPQAAAAVRDALRAGPAVDELVHAIGSWPAAHGASAHLELYGLVVECAAVAGMERPVDGSEDAVVRLSAAVADGALGRDVGDRYRGLLRDRYDLHARLVEGALPRGAPPGGQERSGLWLGPGVSKLLRPFVQRDRRRP